MYLRQCHLHTNNKNKHCFTPFLLLGKKKNTKKLFGVLQIVLSLFQLHYDILLDDKNNTAQFLPRFRNKIPERFIFTALEVTPKNISSNLEHRIRVKLQCIGNTAFAIQICQNAVCCRFSPLFFLRHAYSDK